MTYEDMPQWMLLIKVLVVDLYMLLIIRHHQQDQEHPVPLTLAPVPLGLLIQVNPPEMGLF